MSDLGKKTPPREFNVDQSPQVRVMLSKALPGQLDNIVKYL